MRIDLKQMQLLLVAFLVNGADQHAAGFDAHHGAGRKVGNGDAGLADELFRLVEQMDA